MSRRIVSLLPAATEIVCALDARGQLVGRSHECDFPPDVQSLPAVTRARLDPAACSADIERRVKALSGQAQPLYELDSELLKELRPDLILTQAQCAVCAVSLAEVERAVARWPSPPQIIPLSPKSLADVWSDMRTVAVALGAPEQGKPQIRALKIRCVDIIERTAALANRPTVACLEWLDPLMAAGNWVPELVHFAGGLDLFGDVGKHSPWLDWSGLVKRDPDVIVALPCGFDLARTRREMAALTQRTEWGSLRAVKRGRVFLTDGSQFFNRPGPRLVESAEILAEILHPSLFRSGHEGRGWSRF